MTVLESLRSTGAPEAEVQQIATVVASMLPLNRRVSVTHEILEAARAHDYELVRMLLIEEDEPEDDEMQALKESHAEDDGRRSTLRDALAARNGR